MFVEVRLRFEKSSPRWRIVGREEIRGDKIYRKSFLKLIERDSVETKRQNERERRFAAGQDRARSTGVQDVYRHSLVDRSVDRGKEAVDRCG